MNNAKEIAEQVREKAIQIILDCKGKEHAINEIENLVKQAQQETADKILEAVKKGLELNTHCSKTHEVESDAWREDVWKRNGLEQAISTIEKIREDLETKRSL